jgi:hypothetical protein
MGLVHRRNLMPGVMPVPEFGSRFTLVPEPRRNATGIVVLTPRVLWVVGQFDRYGRLLASHFFSDSGPTFASSLRCGRDYVATVAPAQWVSVLAAPDEAWDPVEQVGLLFPRPRLVWELAV